MVQLLRRIRHLIARSRFERDLREELAFHRDMAEQDLRRDGADPADAAARARRAFGSGALAGDRARDVWISPWLQDVGRDARLAVRLLGRDRAFTALAAIVLGLGIGVTNLQAVLVNAICVRGLPIPHVDRVAFLAARDAHDRELPLSYEEFDAIRTSTPAVPDAAAFSTARAVVGDDGLAPDRALVVYISPHGLDLVGGSPVIGRTFDANDDRPGATPVAILARAFWMSRYAGDRSIVGRLIDIDGVPTTVIGVMADDFRFPATTDLWRPLALMPGIADARRTSRTLSVVGRLAAGQSFVDLRAQLAAVAAQTTHDYPSTSVGIRLTAEPINDKFNGRLTDRVWLAFMSVGVLVLLVACANAANLLLMRSATRAHEMALRASLGASRGRLVRQLLIESAALAIVGGVVGVGVSLAAVRGVESLTPANALAYFIRFTIDRGVLALICAISLGSVFVFGLAPAVHVSNVDVGSLAKDGSRGVSAGRHAHRWTTAFLTAEFGLTMVTVAGIVLGWRQTRDAARADLEIAPERIVTAGVTLSSPRYASPEKKVAFYDAVAERVGRAPEVAAFAVATYAPRGGAAARPTLIEGEDRPAGQPPPTAWVVTIGGRYFEALGLHVVKGRAFDERDGSPGHAAVIVNSRFVDMYLRSREPIGRRIALIDPAAPGSPEWLTVVGVSPTIRQRPTPDPDPMAYVPIRMAPPLNAVLLARATTDAARIAPALRAAAAAIDPTLPLDRLMSMEQAMTLAQWNGRLSVALLDGIGLVALALAAIGVYAVTSYSVTQRRQEIGVRMALGADGRQIAAMVLGRAARQLAWGLGAGVVCIAAWGRLFGDGGDPHGGMSGLTNLAIVAAVIGVVVAAACVVPVRRAARLDPVVALRRE